MRLVTGGSGFLGIALARLLLDEGYEVRVFDMKRSPLLPEKAGFFEGDIRDRKAVAAACEGASHVYHLAALLPQSKAPKKVMRAVHVGGALNVLDACVEKNVQSVVYLSSTEVYGRMTAIPCPEDAPGNPVGEYGRNKVEGEKLCLRYVREKGLRISILRPPTLIGPGIAEEGINKLMGQLRRGGVLPVVGRGKNRVQALDVRDCARAVFLCGGKPEAAGEIFNVRCDDVPTMLEMALEMKRTAGTRVKIIRIPAAVGINAFRLLNVFDLSPVRPEHYELMMYDFVSDTSKIKNMLGWKPEKTYAESAADMYEWFLKEGRKR